MLVINSGRLHLSAHAWFKYLWAMKVLLTVFPFISSEVTDKQKLVVSAKHSLLQAASSLPSDISQLQPQSVIPVWKAFPFALVPGCLNVLVSAFFHAIILCF